MMYFTINSCRQQIPDLSVCQLIIRSNQLPELRIFNTQECKSALSTLEIIISLCKTFLDISPVMVQQPHLCINSFRKCALTCPKAHIQNAITCTEIMPCSIIIYRHRKKFMVCKNHSNTEMNTDANFFFSDMGLYTEDLLTEYD